MSERRKYGDGTLYQRADGRWVFQRSMTSDTAALIALVDEQAEDEGLWFFAHTAPEAYLQQELRRPHSAVEAYANSRTDTATPNPVEKPTGSDTAALVEAARAVVDAKPMDWSVPHNDSAGIDVPEPVFDRLLDTIDRLEDVLRAALEATDD